MSSPNQYSAKAKFQMVLEALREQNSQLEIARSYGINVKLLSNWKRHFLDQGHTIFDKTTKRDESAHKITELEKIIGKQTVELELAKRFLGHLGSRGRLS